MSANITLTERAARRINAISEKEGANALRVAVLGGGCSGFQYEFSMANERSEDDIVVERDGATVLIDSVSLVYVLGSEIDFVDDLIGAQFQINNPNATASCGCGTSFSI
jgi:iron-sulfur cluster assembly accessory protein